MLDELRQYLTAYLAEAIDEQGLARRFSEFDWSQTGSLTDREREALGLFELLTTEVLEGLRDRAELIAEADAWLRSNDASWRAGRQPRSA